MEEKRRVILYRAGGVWLRTRDVKFLDILNRGKKNSKIGKKWEHFEKLMVLLDCA
jgi:hypothetical protein